MIPLYNRRVSEDQTRILEGVDPLEQAVLVPYR